MGNNEHQYSIEELAEQVDLPVRTIRYYISEGLLPGPGARGKAALYGEEHFLRLRLIRLLSRQHVPLAEMHNRVAHLSISEISALLAEEEEYTTQLEEAEPSPSEGYVAALLRKARAARQTQPPTQAPFVSQPMPEQSRLKRAPESPLAPQIPVQTSEPELWQRWELVPGIELHVRTDIEEKYRDLLERLFLAAGKRYPLRNKK